MKHIRPAPDRDCYAVHCWYPGIKAHDWIVRDAGGFAAVVDDIISGEIEGAETVVQFNLGEGTCRDVTEDVARAVYNLAEPKSDGLLRDDLRELVHAHIGVEACP